MTQFKKDYTKLFGEAAEASDVEKMKALFIEFAGEAGLTEANQQAAEESRKIAEALNQRDRGGKKI